MQPVHNLLLFCDLIIVVEGIDVKQSVLWSRCKQIYNSVAASFTLHIHFIQSSIDASFILICHEITNKSYALGSCFHIGNWGESWENLLLSQ
jgi:ABC-type iron transport system FetAB permease component